MRERIVETTDLPSDLQQWRADTPGCRRRVHLNNAGAALMPAAVLDTMTTFLERESLIGGYEAADEAAEAVEAARGAMATLLDSHRRNIAFAPSGSNAFAQAMLSLDFRPGDRIVTSRTDYVSNHLMFLALRARFGVDVLHIPELPEGGLDLDGLRGLLRAGRCKVVTVSWMPTNSGLVQDAAGVGHLCREAGVRFILDAVQVVGQRPVSMQEIPCDFLVATSPKYLRGPRGVGVLWISDDALAAGLYPITIDSRGGLWTGPLEFEPAVDGRRFEGWEASYALILGLGEAARYCHQVGLGPAAERILHLAG